MDDVKSSSQLRIALSLSVALLFHTLVGIFLAKWIPHEPVVTIDNISVTLKQPDSVASTNNSGEPLLNAAKHKAPVALVTL